MDKIIVGLTGGIACGKTLFGGFLGELGAGVICLDEVGRAVCGRGSVGVEGLVAVFGGGVLRGDGELDRGVLRGILMGSEVDRGVIEGVLYPLILARMWGLYEEAGERVVVVEGAVLFEKGLGGVFDEVILVDCDEVGQVERVIERAGVGEEMARRMIGMQMNREERVREVERVGGVVVVNDGGVEGLREEAVRVYEGLIGRGL